LGAQLFILFHLSVLIQLLESFKLDPASPQFVEEGEELDPEELEGVDYEILSKEI